MSFNLSINTQALGKKLKLIQKIVAEKTIIPIMSNALLRTDGNELHLATTNTEISITTSCPAVITSPGVITVPCKALLDIVSQIQDETTHLTVEKHHVRIAASAFKMRLPILPPDDFPTLPTLPEGGTMIPGDVFRTMIKKVRSAISDADKRYFMNGALFSLTENAIALITTDGKRLALATAQRSTPGPTLQIVIPTKTLDVIVSDEGHEDLLFAQGARQMFFVSEDCVLSSRTVDGSFPNYQKVIPRENTNKLTIPRTQLLAALRRVSLAAGDTHAMTLLIEPNALSLSSSDVQVGDAVEHVPVIYAGPSCKLAMDWHFILDFLTSAVGQTIMLALKDANTASLWTDGNDYINVIMPMRA